MKKFLILTGSVLAMQAGASSAEAGPCRNFDRQFLQNGFISYQSGTECLNRWGNWNIIAINDNHYYSPPPVQYVTVERPVYTPNFSLNLGFLDIARLDNGRRYYGRNQWHDNDNHHWRAHNGQGRSDDDHHGRH